MTYDCVVSGGMLFIPRLTNIGELVSVIEIRRWLDRRTNNTQLVNGVR
jgi:hypothetical protein